MTFSMSTEWLTIASVVTGVAGLAFALWQFVRARSARRMYREKCATRCRDLVESVKYLARASNEACRVKEEHFDELMSGQRRPEDALRPLRELSDQIHSIDAVRNQLIRFCERLNEEYEEEFGIRVIDRMRDEFPPYVASERHTSANQRPPNKTLQPASGGQVEVV